MNTQQAFLQSAIEHRQAGRLEQAVESYLAILQSDPNHAEAHHGVGEMALLMNQPQAALSCFLKALEADAACGQYWISYIDALNKAGQVEEARQVLELARRQGLQGAKVDALAATLGAGLADAQGELQSEPSARQIEALIALFSAGKLVEAATEAQSMTVRFPRHGFGWKMLGAIYKQAGLNAEALLPMQNAAALLPDDAEAHYNLGLTHQDLGNLNEAKNAYLHALRIDPDFFHAHNSLGVLSQSQGQIEDAQASFREAIRVNPRHADAHNNLGNALKEAGHADQAIACYRRALQINPDHLLARSNLGLVLEETGALNEAAACFQSVLERMPDAVDALCNLGNIFKKQEKLQDAEACFRRALKIRPDMAELHFNLGNTLKDLKRSLDAEVSYRQAIQIRPDYAEAYYNLGVTQMLAGWMSEAEESLRNALRLKPDYADAYSNLGVVLQGVGRMDEGVACYQRVVQINPGSADAYNNLGNALRDSGKLEEAKAVYRQALELDPGHAEAHSNLIFALDLAAGISIEEMQYERRRWGRMHAAHLLGSAIHQNIPDATRRLRIGYVSADFRTNSAPTVFAAMLFDYDRAHFDVFAYSNETRTTELTERFEQSVTGWRNIFGKSDDEVAAMIRQDGIDILVDLSGHSGRNRLPVFAMKPAPVQVTAWGYSTGTGIKAIDALFSDPILIPPEERALYAEQIRYLPVFFSYYPCQTPPEVGPLPALTAKQITFGTFTRMEKVTEETYRAWAEVLLAVPGSRMMFKNHEMDHARARERVTGYFTRAGVAAERLIFRGRTKWEEHLAAFNQIDIALDTFPQGGGVTTLEGLLMGVPLITLCWPTFAGRTGKSILTALGLPDWVAETPEQYVEIARQKAQDIQALDSLRRQLRDRLKSSVIGDTRGYARIVEQEYRSLWRNWCETNSSGKGNADGN